MDKPQIDRILIDNYELIDSRVINLFRTHFDVFVENLAFHFEFIDDRSDRVKIEISRYRGDDIFDVSIYNFETGGLQGFFAPNPIGDLGKTRYHFSITGIAHENRRYKSIVFNLFQEVENG
jgi:hypothetical protein